LHERPVEVAEAVSSVGYGGDDVRFGAVLRQRRGGSTGARTRVAEVKQDPLNLAGVPFDHD